LLKRALALFVDFLRDDDLGFHRGDFLVHGRPAQRLLRPTTPLRRPLLAVRVNVDRAAIHLERLDLLFGGERKPLEIERRSEPRAIELDHVHPELQIVHGDLLLLHECRFIVISGPIIVRPLGRCTAKDFPASQKSRPAAAL
jgi:hypothetical protein